MPLPSIIDACRLDLYTPDAELAAKYPAAMADRIRRIREAYNVWLSNPMLKDRAMCSTIMQRFDVSQSRAYADIGVLHQLIPMLAQKARGFHLAVFNEMVMETYAKAKARGDTRAMAAAVATYGKYNNIDKEDEMSMPYEDIVPQPFAPTLDVSVLGLKPIPQVEKKIDALNRELARDCADIEDVEYELADIEENLLFAPVKNDTDKPAL